MYLDYFALNKRPFSISPDPSFLFPSKGHQEALAHLHYACSNHGGLVALTGEVGMGKTMLCRAFIDNLDANIECAYIFNPQMSAGELLATLCQELHIECPQSESIQILTQALFAGLLNKYAQGIQVLCIIDEAQSMPLLLLEQIRLLTNLETSEHKLLTLILVGQPELAQVLMQHNMRQLNQRITARYHLTALSPKEVAHYVQHRIQYCGGTKSIFTAAALRAVAKLSQGIPRLINSLADRALLGAYAQNMQQVSTAIVTQAAQEIGGYQPPPATTSKPRTWRLVGGVVVLALIIGIGVALTRWEELNKYLIKRPLSAAQQLAQAYQLHAQDCPQIKQQGWQCLTLNWSLRELRQLKRPVMIKTTQGWQAMGAQMQGRYTKQALILWQPPANYRRLIRPGDKSPVVQWVRNRFQLNMFNWTTINPASAKKNTAPPEDFYDPLLARAVGKFQKKMGILNDQIIGPQTLLYLQEKQN